MCERIWLFSKLFCNENYKVLESCIRSIRLDTVNST